MIKENISRIQENIAYICQKLDRDPAAVTVVAVTKFAPFAAVQEAIDAGISHVGENKVQEAAAKFTQISNKTVQKHMIGHLQTNKVKQALDIFDLIQSVDSLKLAQEIEKQSANINKTANILLQINTAGEEQKFGADPREGLALADEILKLPHIHIKGFMTIAPFTEDERILRSCFEDLRKLSEHAQTEFKGCERFEQKYLSMGMTEDYDIALEEGSNMVRIGRAIFS